VVQIWYLKMVTFTANKLLAGNNYALFQASAMITVY